MLSWDLPGRLNSVLIDPCYSGPEAQRVVSEHNGLSAEMFLLMYVEAPSVLESLGSYRRAGSSAGLSSLEGGATVFPGVHW